jgi:ribosome-binding ATPase YchF (GTP1/OBG family)
MKTAILGLPQSGRTTLYKYLGDLDQPDDRLPKQCIMKVPDPRLDKLVIEFSSAQSVSAEVMLFDSIGNLESDGRTLETVRPADLVIWQLRGFSAGFGEPDPIGDYAILCELAMEKDMDILKKRLENIEKSLSRGMKADEKKQLEHEKKLSEKMIDKLSQGISIREERQDETGARMIAQYGLISGKPALIHVSCDEDLYSEKDALIEKLSSSFTDKQDLFFLASMPRFEMELSELSEEDKKEFMDSAGIVKTSRDEVLQGIFEASGQEVF